MFRNFLALFMVSFLAAPLSFASSTAAPCNLADQSTLDALSLGEHVMKVERKEVSGKDNAPVTAYVCTYTSPSAPQPALTVTTVAMLGGGQTLKPSCTDLAGGGGLKFSICTAIVKKSVATFSLSMKSSSSINNSFFAQIEKLIKKLAGPDSEQASTK